METLNKVSESDNKALIEHIEYELNTLYELLEGTSNHKLRELIRLAQSEAELHLLR